MKICGIHRGLAAIVVCCAYCSFSLAQSSPGDTLGRPPGSAGVPGQTGAAGQSGTATGVGGLPGGAAMADFDTLMNLIQQTIDPDSWLAAGGTNSLLPYPAGVYVDPQGHLRRVRESAELSHELLTSASERPRHPWRTTSPRRTVSLKRLEQELTSFATSGLRPTTELLKLAGLSRIQYVKVDVATEDVLIAGPAADQALPGQDFGFLLEDLAVVASLVNTQTAPLGCSIEPSDTGLLAAQQMFQDPAAIRRLARNPQMVVEQMQEKIGPHLVRVFGMNPQSTTAVALVEADAHMKQLGFGTVATRTPVDSYFHHLDRQASVPNQSLIRWWFAYADEPIRANAEQGMFELPEQCVAVLSEQQWVGQQGRAPTGASDAAADAFAEGISERLDDLRTTHASYARLCAVFESALALQLTLESTGQPSLAAWFPNLCSLGQRVNSAVQEPVSVEGLTTWHKLKNGTIVAVVSGGVKIDTMRLASRKSWQPSQFLASSLVPEPASIPSSAHGTWWWD
jgi:hypothetical protein